MSQNHLIGSNTSGNRPLDSFVFGEPIRCERRPPDAHSPGRKDGSKRESPLRTLTGSGHGKGQRTRIGKNAPSPWEGKNHSATKNGAGGIMKNNTTTGTEGTVGRSRITIPSNIIRSLLPKPGDCFASLAMTTAIKSSRYCHCEESRDARDDAAISIFNLCDINNLSPNLDKTDFRY
jgi:hypothetical protein